MKHEFKVTRSKDQTVYTLESATGGSSSAGGNASVSTALGGVQRRPADTIFAQEGSKDKVDAGKPRNFVAKNAKMGGAGKMKDKSKTIPRHEKHKKPVAEGFAEYIPLITLVGLVYAYLKHKPSTPRNRQNFKDIPGFDYSDASASILKDVLPKVPKDDFGYPEFTFGFDFEGLGNLLRKSATRYFIANYGNERARMIVKDEAFMDRLADSLMYDLELAITDIQKKYKQDANPVLKQPANNIPPKAAPTSDKQTPSKISYSFKGTAKEDQVDEEWSQKYKSSINCSHPKGFSQKAHCAGKNKHEESMMTMEAVCPDCGMCETHGDNMMEVKQRLDAKCWKGYRKAGTKMKGGVRVNNCVPVSEGAEDHEIKMASSELQSIAKNAVHLLDLVRKYSEQEGLQAWQQSKITKAADYLNSVLQSISGEQSGMEEARDNYHANTTGFGRRPRDDERHDLDTQVDPRETMMWNLTVDGKPLNPEPIMGRSNLIKFGKQQAAAGVDLSNAVISPVKEMEEDDSALQAFLAKGGKIQVGKTHPPRKAEKWQGSSHIGAAGGKGTKGSVSGLGANTKTGNKPVVSVEEDAYMMELAAKLAEKIPANADVDYYIKDFAKSTAPQFKGKNPAKRKQMAIAAYYGSKQKKK